MKTYKYLFCVLLFLMGSISCKKSFLDVDDNSFISREQDVKDIFSLQQYLNGVYVLLGKDFYGGSDNFLIYSEVIGDNAKPSSTNITALNAHYLWNQQSGVVSDALNMSGLWKKTYSLIRSCNFIVEKAETFKEKDINITNQIKAEALGLRALLHFTLVNIFAQSYNFSNGALHLGVPYITSWDWNDPIKRNTVAEVYNQMIGDLNIAVPLFSNTTSKLVMNRMAAKALLARIYLFKEDWIQAKTIATEVAIAVPLLKAADYPTKLFTPDESEALFQCAPSSTEALPGSYTTSFQGVYFRSTAYLSTRDIALLLTKNSNDSRSKWIVSSSIGIDSIRKYPINIVPGFGTGINLARSYYQTVFRSSEMFLTVAEASAKSGDETTARQYLDAIRKRANPAALNSVAVGNALLDSIYIERRKELAFEGLRMFDLLRWKQGVNRTDVTIGAPKTLPYPSNKAISPIPQSDVNIGIQQNAGY